jgi:hypothetical protein
VELVRNQQITDWTDLGREMGSFLPGREAAINYTFRDLVVEVPRDTGAQAPRARPICSRHASLSASQRPPRC